MIFFVATKTARNGGPIGFIGLGNMGRGMAKNLIEKGHQVVAFDANQQAVKEAVSNGAKEATSPKVCLLSRYVPGSCTAAVIAYSWFSSFFTE